MAAPADYFQRYDLTDGDSQLDRSGDNVREDFMNVIYNIAPTQTPFMTGIGRGTSKDVFTSWQQDDIEEPNSANAALDGADIGADVVRQGPPGGQHQPNLDQEPSGYWSLRGG